jgi:hypothetical protein
MIGWHSSTLLAGLNKKGYDHEVTPIRRRPEEASTGVRYESSGKAKLEIPEKE